VNKGARKGIGRIIIGSTGSTRIKKTYSSTHKRMVETTKKSSQNGSGDIRPH
jgi:hypothetical protein